MYLRLRGKKYILLACRLISLSSCHSLSLSFFYSWLFAQSTNISLSSEVKNIHSSKFES